ncbi:DNA/RNA nuclease SfsA [Asticcacaulis machinosus]|uniref:Sugar fermentation stimulation protein homolog n=1 Tax=Asticcacaulis machinosus TaxID=2984211 RepID=A0ABT5HGL4_9CAUL|nr:DNA/RNA nuclease SfsA [Asticcacaulis machinosus]MDC7675128.1 DNA/RNA nuclease SfsA [Asticcacaulis machinosus]
MSSGHIQTTPFEHRVDGLIKGRLVSRYKRFFADIRLESGEIVTAHCPNPGKMLGLLVEDTPALITESKNPKAKLKYRLEALKEGDQWVGVNTGWPNMLIKEAIIAGLVSSLSGYPVIRPEVRYGHNSRIDLKLEDHPSFADAYVEVKNVHLSRTSGLAEFPDCVTERGAKHLYELIDMVAAGYRAVVVFCVQRDDVDRFDACADLDPKFAAAYRTARAAGVEIIALSFGFDENGLSFKRTLEIL